ncbi:MAG: hypothetical protein LBK28_06585, partial [Propionibacteriaceae bacterium]|nr:hypothetical protein [Propionibacteriaceae bacterium]
MSFRKPGRVIAAVAALALALTACTDGGSGTSSGPSGEPGGVTLTLWHSSADNVAARNLYQAYEKATGNTIELI